jgi:hypothetical protein
LVSDVKGGRMFEERVLRRILEPQRDEVMGGWIKLHNEKMNA